MDFLKRIEELSAIYDDDGPSAVDQGSRNMFNNGGMLVQPSNDGSRPGYKGEKKLITIKQLAELDLPYSESTLSNVFSSTDRNKNLKKLFKDNNIKVVSKGPKNTLLFDIPSAKQIDNLWQDSIKLIESGKATVPDKMRNPFKNEVLKVFNEFKKTNTPFTTSDIYYKVVENVGDNKRIFIPKKLKGDTRVPGESIKVALGKENSEFLLDGNIARIEKTTTNRKKMFDLLLKGETDVTSLAKNLGINKKDVYAEANKLFDDSYRYNANLVRKTGAGSGYGYLKDYNQSDFNTVLKNLRNSGFEKLDERSARALIYDAYKDSPKKFDAALKKLSEYNKINTELRNTFGKGFQLDHTLSFKALKDLGNTTPENLIRLNPLPENINKMKVAFDRSYNNIITQLRDGNISPNISKNLLEKKKLIEDISTKTNIGSFKVDASGKKILSFGSQPFLKTNIPSQMLKNVDVQNRLVNVLKDYSDEDLKKITKKKSIESLRNLEKIPKKEINAMTKTILKNIQGYSKLPQCKVGAADGGRIGFAYSDECIRDGLKEQKIEAQKGNKKAAQELVQVGKVATRAGLLKNLLGPGAILGEAVYEGAMIGNKVLGGKELDQAWAESYLSYLDPRKYSGQLDSLKMSRDAMTTRKINDQTIDGPNANILRSGFAAQDQVAAFNEAVNERERAKSAGRLDQYNPAAADAREQGRFVDQSKDIISSDAFQDATKQAQEYIANKEAKNRFDLGVFGTPQGELSEDRRMYKANKAMNELFTPITRKDVDKILRANDGYTPYAFGYGMTDEGKYNEDLGYKQIIDEMDKDRKQSYFADNFRTEKAGGGIAKVAGVDKGPAPDSGPNPQGLQRLFKRANNL